MAPRRSARTVATAWPLDISLPLSEATPRFPGDPGVRVAAVRSFERGDPYRLSALSLGSHAGTHLDAPSHFLPDGATVETVELGLLNGPAFVLRVAPEGRAVTAAALRTVPDGTRRLLLRTPNSERWTPGAPFFDDFAALTEDAAEELVRRGVGLVGIDGLTVELDLSGSFPVHRRLLGAGTWILEGLVLRQAAEGPHELRCLPLPLTGVDGAPCRAVLWS